MRRELSGGVGTARDFMHWKGKGAGFTFPVGDVKTLTEHLKILLTNEKLRIELGKQAKEIVEDWNYENGCKGIIKALKFIKK